MQAILAPPLEGSSSADAAQSTSGRVAINGEAWKDRSVLELGCGVGMLSVVAAWMGARVLATDGDPDLVRLAAKNLPRNAAAAPQRHPLQAAMLRWGMEEDYAKAQKAAGCAAFDIILLSDVVYGSNPGAWQRLAATLRALAGPHTVVLQSETFRLEGRYDEYYTYLAAEGFDCSEVSQQRLEAASEVAAAGNVRMWHIRKAISPCS